MGKFFGAIGYCENVETSPGLFEEQIVRRNYYGDVINNTRRLQFGDRINGNINISNEISIVADPYAMKNFYMMRYVEFMGAKWIITDAEVQHPRLKLTIGGLYNE